MQGDNESPPFAEVEELCEMFGVEYNVYALTASLRRVITAAAEAMSEAALRSLKRYESNSD